MFCEQLTHAFNVRECVFAYGYGLKRPVGKNTADNIKIFLCCLLISLAYTDLTFKTRNLIMNVCLVRCPLFQLRIEFPDLFLGLIFKHCIFRTGKLCRDVTENIFIFLEGTSLHRVLHHLGAIHY